MAIVTPLEAFLQATAFKNWCFSSAPNSILSPTFSEITLFKTERSLAIATSLSFVLQPTSLINGLSILKDSPSWIVPACFAK